MGSGDDRRDLQPTSLSKASLNQLTRLAHEHLQKGDLQKAMEHFESAVEKSKNVGDTSVRVSCYLNAGACLVSLGQYKRGLSFLESAAGIIKTFEEESSGVSEKVQMLEMSADVHYNTAVAAQGLREYEKAVTSFKACIDFYMKAGSKGHAAEAFSSLANCHGEAGFIDKQIDCLKSAQQLYNELGDPGNEALVYLELAKVYLSSEQKDKCKQMLSTAKMLCLRVDNAEIQGKLHSQFGLIYTSLGMFDDAIQSFERALPLFRVGKTTTSLRMEASILQNIGAAYNEKGLYSEGVIYHREAANLHGKTKNFNSEAKCLCNLAFAHTQLKDYPAASESFKNAFSKAQSANNHYLQFQATEGLGAVHYQLEEYNEAIKYFNQALAALDNIKQDTGMARERVMEKLSNAVEALQKEQQAQARKSRPRSRSRSQSRSPDPDIVSDHGSCHASDHEEHISTTSHSPHGSTNSLDRPRKSSSPPKQLARRLSPELNSVATRTQIDFENLPLPEKKGGFLPPIEPSKSPQLTGRHHMALDPIMNGSRKSHKHATPSKRKGHKHKQVLPKITESRRAVLKPLDSYDEQLHAYMDTYADRKGEGGASSLGSSSESSLSSGGSQHSRDQLGASIFSRHATHKTKHKHKSITRPPHKLSPPPLSASQSASPAHSPLVVQEGSLAIGPNAREMFTTQSHPIQNGQKRRKGKMSVQTEIVSKNMTTPQPQDGTRSHLPDPPIHSPIGSTVRSQSKVCAIL